MNDNTFQAILCTIDEMNDKQKELVIQKLRKTIIIPEFYDITKFNTKFIKDFNYYYGMNCENNLFKSTIDSFQEDKHKFIKNTIDYLINRSVNRNKDMCEDMDSEDLSKLLLQAILIQDSIQDDVNVIKQHIKNKF